RAALRRTPARRPDPPHGRAPRRLLPRPPLHARRHPVDLPQSGPRPRPFLPAGRRPLARLPQRPRPAALFARHRRLLPGPPRAGRGTGEQSLFRGLRDQFRRGDVLLGDRLYGDFFTLAWARAKGIDVVTRPAAGRAPLDFRGRRADDRRLCWVRPPRPDWMS